MIYDNLLLYFISFICQRRERDANSKHYKLCKKFKIECQVSCDVEKGMNLMFGSKCFAVMRD